MSRVVSAVRSVTLGLLAGVGVFAICLVPVVLLGAFGDQSPGSQIAWRAVDQLLADNPFLRAGEILALLALTGVSVWALAQIKTGAGPDEFPKPPGY